MDAKEMARRSLKTPRFVRDWDYHVQTVRTGDGVLSAIGVTMADVLDDPTLLFVKDEAYGGGSSLRIDPFHPAARALIALRLSAGTLDEDILETAVAMAADALAEHGVPPEIKDAYAIGDRANNFSVWDVLGVLYTPPAELRQRRTLWPRISQRLKPTIPPSSWAARVDAAHAMIGACVAMPAHHHARAVVIAYTEVLANPAVPTRIVTARGIQAGIVLGEEHRC